VRSQSAVCQRQIVLQQRRRRLRQAWIVSCCRYIPHPCIPGTARVAVRLEIVRQDSPPVRGRGLQIYRPAYGRDTCAQVPRLGAGDPKLQVHRCRVRQLAPKWFEYFERQLHLTDYAVRGTQNQTRTRMGRNGLEDLACVLRGESGITLQQSRGTPKRHIQCSNGLRNAVQLNILSIPTDCYRPRAVHMTLDVNYSKD
jgi:hypothetical protein